MLEKVAFCCCAFLAFSNLIGASSFSRQLDNGVSVVCVNTNKIDSVLIAFCISAGVADEMETDGVANLLGTIFLKRLNKCFQTFKGIFVDFAVGYDQSIAYVYCQKKDLEDVIKCVADEFEHLSFNDDDILRCKQNIENVIMERGKVDSLMLRESARNSLYRHAKYGTVISGSIDQVKRISKADLINYKNNFYKADRLGIVVVGNVSKNKVANWGGCFSAGKSCANNRLVETAHHDSVVRIIKTSQQVNTSTIEMMWRAPCYRLAQEEAIATEIYVNYLEQRLKKMFVIDQKLAVSISLETSLWNYSSGEISLRITLPRKADVQYVETAVLAEIMNCDKPTKDQADRAVDRILRTVPTENSDAVYTLSWLAPKVSAGNDIEFVKRYSSKLKKYNLEKVQSSSFLKSPSVITVLKPE